MQNLGNNLKLLAIIFFIGFISMSSGKNIQNVYYTLSYAENLFGTDVLLSKIDLDAKSIAYSLVVPMRGEIEFKKPIVFNARGRQFFFIATINGMPGKNSEILSDYYSKYSIIDDNENIIAQDSLINIQLTSFSSVNDLAVGIRYINAAGLDMIGILNLNNFNRPVIIPLRQENYDDSEYPVIGGFQYFEKVGASNNRIYWCSTLDGIYLLSIDINENRLIDSINVKTSRPYFYQFGLSDNDSLIYVFFMNSNEISGPPDVEKLSIDSSYVKVFNAADFSFLDSIPIIYPPLDSGYVYGSNGACDKVGPYFVYFDMVGEGYGVFSPAMLFIFDTRTNEASWLRVGWR